MVTTGLPVHRRLLLLSALLLAMSGSVAALEPLPEPLTLQAALAQGDAPHPELASASSALASAQAELESAQARSGNNISLEGRLRWIEPADIAYDQDSADHKASLFWRKRLYDFGRSRGAEEAAEAAMEAQRVALIETRRARRLAILRDYFAVLLADQQFAIMNEGLAVAYVTLDRLRQRHEMGQLSDVDLLENESSYQQVLRKRLEAEQRQRISRTRLANTLNRPGELSATLERPKLSNNTRELAPLEEYRKEALEANPALVRLRSELQAAEARLRAVRAERFPLLDGELELSEYTRESGGYDRWRASINLKVPLYSGGSTSAAVAREQARADAARANLRSAEYALDEALIEQWMALGALKLRRDEVTRLAEFRELYLERSRANYEMEVKADLGDAMVRLSEVQLAELEFELDAALAWEQLDALLGRAVAANND